MTNTYLVRTDDAVLDASGSGTVILKPDVGQYWSPLFIRVASNNQVAPTPYCAVYHGSPIPTVDPYAFIDDTFLGSGDTSSMVSGINVQFGEALIAKFSGGRPGDTVVMSVYGMSSDVPPNLSIGPQVPGTHFAGKLTPEIMSLLTQLGSSTTIASGAQLTLPASNQAFDMRLFSGYYFRCFPFQLSNNFDPIMARMVWCANPDGTVVIGSDIVEWWAQTNVFTSGVMMMSDQIGGPFLQIQLLNTSVDTLDVSFTTLHATTRTIGVPSAEQYSIQAASQPQGPDAVLAHVINQAIPAGGVLKVPCLYGNGRCKFVLHNGGAANMTFNMNPGSLNTFEGYTVGAGATSVLDIISPRRAFRVDV